MASVTLEKILFTKVSYEFQCEGKIDYQLQVKNEISLNLPEDENDYSFLLIIETTITDPNSQDVNMEFVTNAFFNNDEKITDYEHMIKKISFPIAYKEISEKIDSMLEIMGYPKLNLINMREEKS